MKRIYLWPIYAIIVLAGLAAILWLCRDGGAGNYWHVAPLLGSYLLAIGWMVTSENTIRNNARQHTVTVVLNYDSNQANRDHWATIRKYLAESTARLIPGGNIPPYAQAEHELYKAVDFQLNTFEFISVGVLNEVFDANMIKNSFVENFSALYKRAEPYIAFTRRDNPDVWSKYCKVCKKWRVTNPRKQKNRALRLALRVGFAAGVLNRRIG